MNAFLSGIESLESEINNILVIKDVRWNDGFTGHAWQTVKELDTSGPFNESWAEARSAVLAGLEFEVYKNFQKITYRKA